jgi:aminoglycoside phosphotransferase (APT) family kinase protein
VSPLRRPMGEQRNVQHEAVSPSAVPHDPLLPHLAMALDGVAMAGLFARELAASSHLHVQACRVDRIKYRPRRNCSVSYLLLLRDEQTGDTFEQRLAARWCSGGDAARRHEKAVAGATYASAAGPALTFVPSLDLFASWLPNDPKLHALRELNDDARLRRCWLPEVVTALTNGRGQLIDHDSTLVQWVPEHRACARVGLRLGPGAAHTLYAKADAGQRGAVTHAVMLALQRSPAQASGALRTPRPVLWQPAAGLHWQQAESGAPLLDANPQVGVAHAAQAGELLAALHATPVPSPRTVTLAELRQQPHDVAEMLCLVEPGWRPLLDRLLHALDLAADTLPAQPTVTLHGDLHPRNLLLGDDGRLSLIDLDDVHQGPAVIELGSWVADGLYRAVIENQAPRSVAPGWRAFLGAYRDAGGALPDEPLLAWSTAHQLLCQRAYRCVANLKAGRFAAVPALLALAGTIARARSLDAACRADLNPARELERGHA